MKVRIVYNLNGTRRCLAIVHQKPLKNFKRLNTITLRLMRNFAVYIHTRGVLPEATVADYNTYKAIKATGLRGSVRVPALQSQRVNILEDRSSKRDPAHIMYRMAERGITSDAIQGYVDNALFSVTQFNGTRRVFYSAEGVAVLTRTNDYEGVEWIAKTAWDKTDFDKIVETAIKEALNNAKQFNTSR